MIINATLNCASQLNMMKDTDELVASGVKMFHLDVMDGHYVPNLALNMDLLRELKERYPQVEMDAHFMVTNPFDYVEKAKKSGVDTFCFHMTTTNFPVRLASQIKSNGMSAGVVLNPAEPALALLPVIKYINRVTIMSIEPGFSGQPFIPETYEKIRQVAALRKEYNADFDIVIDGGIDKVSGPECVKCGADVLIAGMFVCFGQSNGITESLASYMKLFD